MTATRLFEDKEMWSLNDDLHLVYKPSCTIKRLEILFLVLLRGLLKI